MSSDLEEKRQQLAAAKSISKGFIERKNPIDAARRRLAKSYISSIDAIEAIAEDVETGTKDRLAAYQFLAKEYVSILKQSSDEKITRLKNQIDYYGVKSVSDEDYSADDDDETPVRLDFTKIQEISDV